MDPRRHLPPALIAQARQYLSGELAISEPRHASTVVLTRPGTTELEVYLLRRQVSMEFAGGFCVFPGGGVDPRDYDADIGWAGPTVQEWADLLATDADTARGIVCAAVRETFEESGVLLAGPTVDTLVGDTRGQDWERDRKALEARELAFSDFIAARGLVLRTDLLQLWGTWVTPIFEPKRYNTRFFVAELPAEQITRDVSMESAGAFWSPVSQVLQGADRGDLLLLPPTYCTCLELLEASADGAPGLRATARDLTPIEPEIIFEDDGAYLELPPRLVELGERFAAGHP